MRGSVGAACPFSPPAGRRWRQPDEGRTLPGDAGTIRAPLVIHGIHTDGDRPCPRHSQTAPEKASSGILR
ncbi:hypothetical protein CN116_31145 [Sinorhizobium meliloti]|nr:hypothetical protein CN125_32925 [Sinorhizobium meliloti]RVM39429.1 hypothetical protein CN121_32790 [Sinorhizobium meliloti]RVM55053.1 hypothetical protein CN124_32890 [Sinorhizobium meliloti]RVM58301.1 hypothetical protein CN123_33245 [Sinorhizobium meliloti]RVN17450.1 hypothetical protein CN116_31145 [Sinorhizobium meliloti]